MKKLCALLLLPVLAGCLTSTVKPPSYWPVAYSGPKAKAENAKYGVARAMPVVVRSPYAGSAIAVLRADGTVAFDPLNEFAATPANLCRGVFMDAMAASGLFREVVGPSSIATADVSVEVNVDKLVLDCRQEDQRTAVVEIDLKILKGHSIVASVRGTGTADAADGNYGAAFSGAFANAFVTAFAQLR